MDTALATKTMRRESWAAMLREQASSGLTIHEWCDQNQISTKAFYYRRKQVQAMVLDSVHAPSFVELPEPQVTPTVIDVSGHTSNGSCFSPQLTISARDVIIGVDQNTPSQLVSDILRIIRNA